MERQGNFKKKTQFSRDSNRVPAEYKESRALLLQQPVRWIIHISERVLDNLWMLNWFRIVAYGGTLW
jgi:hypothetical protein